jgi:hypothetical protein
MAKVKITEKTITRLTRLAALLEAETNPVVEGKIKMYTGKLKEEIGVSLTTSEQVEQVLAEIRGL